MFHGNPEKTHQLTIVWKMSPSVVNLEPLGAIYNYPFFLRPMMEYGWVGHFLAGETISSKLNWAGSKQF